MMRNVDQHIKKLISNKNIPYIDVACCKDHRMVYRGFAGNGVNGNEKLYMYSCSKPVTVAAFMMLHEKGKADLDAKVSDFLPEYENITVADGTENGSSAKNKMTIRHLLTMTAGLDYNYTPDAVKKLVKEKPDASTEEIVERYISSPLLFEPGERFNYSLCHDVLAVVVEKISGCRFSEFVKANIFDPLGMNDSSFNPLNYNTQSDVYEYNDGVITKSRGFVPTTPNYESGGSGLVSTVDDYIKFADALACGGVSGTGFRLLEPKTVSLISREQVSKIAVNNNFTCVQGDDYGYGLGVRVRKIDTDWGLHKGEFGWDGAACSYLMIDPKRKISVFIGMHLLNWPRCFKGEHINIVKEIYKQLNF